MGHKCVVPQPSPLAMLAIFHAKQRGMHVRDIAAITGHSKSSIIRWWQQWGQDHDIYKRLIENKPELMADYTFEAYYGHNDRRPQARWVSKATADSALIELIRREKQERLSARQTDDL
jgi:hypothetical protein